MCRRCRYDQCVKVGMSYELPPKMKPRKEAKVEKTPRLLDEATPCSSSSSSATTPGLVKDSLIDRMESEYKWRYRIIFVDDLTHSRASYERRLILEKEYIASHILPRYYHPDLPNDVVLSVTSSLSYFFRNSTSLTSLRFTNCSALQSMIPPRCCRKLLTILMSFQSIIE